MLISKSNYTQIIIFLIISNFILWDYFQGVYQLRFLFLLSVPLLIFVKNNHNVFNKKYFITSLLIGLILLVHLYFSSLSIDKPIQNISIIKILIITFFIYSMLFSLEIFYKEFDKIIKYALVIILIYYCFELFLNFSSMEPDHLTFGLLNNCYNGFQVRYSNLFAEDSHLGMIVAAFIISAIIINIKKKKSVYIFILLILLIILITLYSLSITFIASMMIGSFLAFLKVSGFKNKIFFITLIIIGFVVIKHYTQCASKLVNVAMGLYEKVQVMYPQLFIESDIIDIKTLETSLITKTPDDTSLITKTPDENKVDTAVNNKRVKIIAQFLEKKLLNSYSYYEAKKTVDYNPGQELSPSIGINEIEKKFYNVSTAVYMNSLEVLDNTIKNYPLGIGFDNYYFVFQKYTDEAIEEANLERSVLAAVRVLNQNDASNNFVKLSAEFGLFSLIFYFILILFFFSKKIKVEIKIFLLTIIITQVFVRGAGYFNGGFILATITLLLLQFKKK